jgi:hypothetical protein
VTLWYVFAEKETKRHRLERLRENSVLALVDLPESYPVPLHTENRTSAASQAVNLVRWYRHG